MTDTGAHGLTASLLTRLERIAPVLSVRPLVGGRGGRTFAVHHRTIDTVVHVRPGGADVLDHEVRAARRAFEAGVGPEVLAVLPDEHALVTRWVTGAVLTTADLRDDALVIALGATVRRLHDAPSGSLAREYDALDFRAGYLASARDRGLLGDPLVVAETERTDRIAQELASTPVVMTGVHADLVPSNLVLGAGGLVLIDHEWAGLADPAVDLGSLAATAELADPVVDRLVTAYAAAGGPGTAGADVTVERVRAWREVTRHAWFVWVALGDELGPERARWQAWAARTRALWAARAAG